MTPTKVEICFPANLSHFSSISFHFLGLDFSQGYLKEDELSLRENLVYHIIIISPLPKVQTHETILAKWKSI
jgi:hypothetical protein